MLVVGGVVVGAAVGLVVGAVEGGAVLVGSNGAADDEVVELVVLTVPEALSSPSDPHAASTTQRVSSRRRTSASVTTACDRARPEPGPNPTLAVPNDAGRLGDAMEPDHVSPESDPADETVAASAAAEAPDASAADAEDASSFEPAGAAADPEADAEVDVELVAEADVDDESDLADELEADGSNSDDGAPEESATAAEEDGIDGPSVDELEGRLGEVEQAMAQIQSGQLDEAEATLASLDQRIGSTSD